MLLDVLTLLGALYVLLTIVEYLSSLLKPTTKIQNSDKIPKSTNNSDNSQKDVCVACGQRPEAESKIQYIIMASELGMAMQQPASDLDQYQSEILKRRRRIAAGEVKGFYLAGGSGPGAGTSEPGYPSTVEGSNTGDRRHSSYSGDYNVESDNVYRRSLVKDVKSFDEPTAGSQPNMVGLSKDPERGYYIDPNHYCVGGNESKSGQTYRQQQYQQRSSYDERRSSLDTVPVKLSAPVTIVKSGSGSGSPFKISENSAFTPIQPRRDVSVERRPSLLSATGGSLHSQSVPDISADSGIHTPASTAPSSAMSIGAGGAPGPIQIMVVMKPTSGSGSGQQAAAQQASSTVIWTSPGSSGGANQQRRNEETWLTDNRPRPVIDVSDTESKPADRPPSPVRLEMVQTVTSAFHEPPTGSKLVQPASSESKIPDTYQHKGFEPESPVKWKVTQPLEETQQKLSNSRKPYAKASTTSLASTAALAKATAAANYRNNYYSNTLTSKDFDTVVPHRRQHTPPDPPPPASSELTAPQLLKKQSPMRETYLKQGRQYIAEPQMALSRAVRSTGPIPQQGSKIFYGGNSLNEATAPHPYHPPTMASYEQQQSLAPSPRASGPEAGRFAFGSVATIPAPSFDGAGRQPRQQQRAKFSPRPAQTQYQEEPPNVIWRPAESRSGAATTSSGGSHTHSLSVDEGMGYERSRSRERSSVRRQQKPGYSTDENVQPAQPVLTKAATVDNYHFSRDEDKAVAREITDQGVPTTEDVLKGGNVSSKTRLFEALAEQELHEVDTQHQNCPSQQQRKPVQERWGPPVVIGGGANLTPKHKKMERSHTVHTVRSLMAPDAYQYENAPYNNKNPYLGFQEHGDVHQLTPSPRHSYNAPAFYAAQKLQENQGPSPVIHIPKPEAVQFPPASVSPRSVHRELAVIEKGHPFQQARVVQPQQPRWQPAAPSSQVPQTPAQTSAPLAAVAPVSITVPVPAPAPAPVIVPVNRQVQAPVPAPAPVLPSPTNNLRQERALNLAETEDAFEDELTKMSIADKAKLFEQKAEELSKTKRRYNTIRHKTQPVTTPEVEITPTAWHPNDKDEVMKARSVISGQLANPSDSQNRPILQKSGAADEEEINEQDEKCGNRPAAGSGRNVLIYQRHLDSRRAGSRFVDDGQSDPEQRDRDQRQQTPSAVKPRRIVFLHSNQNNSNTNTNLEPNGADLPPPTPTKKPVDQFGESMISDQNNNEKSEKPSVFAKAGENTGNVASLVNGYKKPSPPPRSRYSESSSSCASDNPIKEEPKAVTAGKTSVDWWDTDAPYTRSIGVREKAKKLMANIAAKHNSTPKLNGHNGITNGHNEQLPSRITVNHDDDSATDNESFAARRVDYHKPLVNGSENGVVISRPPDSALDRFCSRVQDLDEIGNETVEDESFMSVVRAPVTRLQHFERPKPNRRHSTCGSRKSVVESNREIKRDKNGAIIVNQ